MTEDLTEHPLGWTKRQALGYEYTQYSENLPSNLERKFEDKIWQVVISGKAKEPPEIQKSEGFGAMTILYDLYTYIIKNQSGKEIDMLKLLPLGWTAKGIDLTNPYYMPPEIHEGLTKYYTLDFDQKEIVIGNIQSFNGDTDRLIKVLLWNSLISRFTEEVGHPLNEKSIYAMRETVMERRQEVLKALNEKSDITPLEIATQKYLQ